MEDKSHFEHLAEIRSLMERSSRFLSLSGLSGIMAGTYALIGAYIARMYIKNSETYIEFIEGYSTRYVAHSIAEFKVFILLGLAVVALSVTTGFLLTMRRAKKNNQTIWDKAALRMLVNMAIPLVAGGIFCTIMMYHGYIGMVAPGTLIFYGLSLIHGSKYTLDTIRHLGIIEVIIGLISAFDIGNGLFYWALGFGVLHIIYGTVMWWKYERESNEPVTINN
ncbi:MAG: hypothetical protein ACI9UJ_001620 [bacterium]|jgi:hypothetical protein